jgi:hypothetical protein
MVPEVISQLGMCLVAELGRVQNANNVFLNILHVGYAYNC